MIAVIQACEGRRASAGHVTARNGQRVLFVADPEQAPPVTGVWHMRPDDVSSFGVSWRKLVESYNANPRNNPLGLLPAHELYPDEIYAKLVKALGAKRTFILSPGWGLIGATMLTPNYDISFDPNAEAYRRREAGAPYSDFCMLPFDRDEELHYFGSAESIPLFCQLTQAYPGRRIVYYRSESPPEAPDCELRKFESTHAATWYQECAAAFLTSRTERTAENTPPRVSNLEARLQAIRQARNASLSSAPGAAQIDERAVRDAIHEAGDEIAEYLWLMRRFREVNVTENEEFRARFNAFYRIWQRSKEWYAAYYRLLETARTTGARFAKVLDVLWEQTGRYEPAYASKLVATIDPTRPNWDQQVLTHTGLRAPSYLDPDKLERAAQVYRQIDEWYARRLKTPGAQRILELFDEEVADHKEISALKKLEFVQWHQRTEPRLHPVSDLPRASASALPSTR